MRTGLKGKCNLSKENRVCGGRRVYASILTRQHFVWIILLLPSLARIRICGGLASAKITCGVDDRALFKARRFLLPPLPIGID